MKRGSSWSVFLSAASYCIWQVESSYPTSLPRNPIDQYHSEVSLCLLHPLFHDSKHSHQQKSYFRLNIWWDVIYVQREQQGTKNGSLGDTRQNRSPVRFYSIYNNSLLSEAKKRIYPFQCLATDSIAKQFAFKEFMRGYIKCLFKIQYECVNLSSIVQDFSPIIYYRSQLSCTTMSFPECMFPIWQEFIFIQMGHDIWTYYVFE